VGSRITCPIVKHNICGKCGKTGHFRGACKVSAKKAEPIKVITKPVIKTSNTFDFSSDESEVEDAEDEDEPEYAKEFPALETKLRRIFKDEGMIAKWQQEFRAVLDLPVDQRNNGQCYWDKERGLIVKKKYKIEGEFLRYTPSWASEDEYEE